MKYRAVLKGLLIFAFACSDHSESNLALGPRVQASSFRDVEGELFGDVIGGTGNNYYVELSPATV